MSLHRPLAKPPMPGTDSPASWAPYMAWAKTHPHARYDLTGSNLLPCTLEDLPGAREAVELFAPNDEGYPPLLDAIGGRYGMRAEQVATAAGAAGANFLAQGALVRPGDTVLVEWPGYDPQAGAARLLGAEVRTFARVWEDGFRLDPQRIADALTPRTRVVVLTNPHNPTGAYASPAELREVGVVADTVGAKVLVDEVYLDALTGVDTTPAARLGGPFLTVNSLTKSFGLSGLRIGWVLSDPDTIRRVRRTRDVVDGIGATPSERLGVLAFSRMDDLLERARGILVPNGARLRGFVEERTELEWVPPVGGAVAFPRLAGADDAEGFVDRARTSFGVGVVPGRFFGAPAHFRVAVSGRRDVLEAGLEALGRALDARTRQKH
ncbi:MAG: pyridoxal phosphate-dependent aminotransferase [Gemmatimonadota bacterium]